MRHFCPLGVRTNLVEIYHPTQPFINEAPGVVCFRPGLDLVLPDSDLVLPGCRSSALSHLLLKRLKPLLQAPRLPPERPPATPPPPPFRLHSAVRVWSGSGPVLTLV